MRTFKVVTRCIGGGDEVTITASEIQVFQGVLNLLNQGEIIASFAEGNWHYVKEVN